MSPEGFGERPSTSPRGRALFLLILVCSIFLIYLIHLFSLQIVRGLEFRTRATQVARRMIPIPAQRGEIYDRNADVPIVLNIDSFAVDVVPAEVPADQMQSLQERLAEVLEIPVSEIAAKLTFERLHLYQPVEILGRVPQQTIFYLAERIDEFPGVTWHNKPIRSYLESGSIAHVLGYVNDITTEELQVLYNRGYKPGDTLGKRGVEKEYDMVLRGKDGVYFSTVDVRGRRVEAEGQDLIEPENGSDVVLTIDRHIQRLSEKALGPRIGSVVVLKPSTGEILALVSYPWFDPNMFYKDRDAEAFRELSLDSRYPFLNRAIQSSYAPASTFKILMTTALVEEQAIDLDEEVECNGEYILGDRTFRCWKEHGHGLLSLMQGLAQSCNVYFLTAGVEHLGVEPIVDYMHRFGFGELTGIDLPGEAKGLAPSPRWKESVRGTKWVGGDTANMSIGEGFTTVTPLQMANMIALIANEGTVYQPHVLKEIRDPVSGEVTGSFESKVLTASSISDETFRITQQAMREVIVGGTAEVVVSTDAVEIAAKTGTGQVGSDENWNSWFAAYGPYEGPLEERIVVVVMVEAANEWEWWAPKAANVIFHGIFTGQNYEETVDDLNIWYLWDQRSDQ